MKTLSILSRFRLIINVLALAVALVALAYAPPPAFADDIICDEGCVAWDAQRLHSDDELLREEFQRLDLR